MTTFWAKMKLYNLAQKGEISEECAEHFIEEISKHELIINSETKQYNIPSSSWGCDTTTYNTKTNIKQYLTIENIIKDIYSEYCIRMEKHFERVFNSKQDKYRRQVEYYLAQIMAFYQLINSPLIKYKSKNGDKVFLTHLLKIDANKKDDFTKKVNLFSNYNISDLSQFNFLLEINNIDLKFLAAIKGVRDYFENDILGNGNWEIYHELDNLYNHLHNQLDDRKQKRLDAIISDGYINI